MTSQMDTGDIVNAVLQARKHEVRWFVPGRDPGLAREDLDVEEHFAACGAGLGIEAMWVVLDNTEGLLVTRPRGRSVNAFTDAESRLYAARIAEAVITLAFPGLRVEPEDLERDEFRLSSRAVDLDPDVRVIWAFPGVGRDPAELVDVISNVVPLGSEAANVLSATFGIDGGGMWEPSPELARRFLERTVALACTPEFHLLERGLLVKSDSGTVAVFAQRGAIAMVPPAGWDAPSPNSVLEQLATVFPYMAVASHTTITRMGGPNPNFARMILYCCSPLGDVRHVVRDPEHVRADFAELHVVGDAHEPAFPKEAWRQREALVGARYVVRQDRSW
jgi:hypothetical protein